MKGQRSLSVSGSRYMWSATGAKQAYHRPSPTTPHTPAFAPFVCAFAPLARRTRPVCAALRSQAKGSAVRQPPGRLARDGRYAPAQRGAGSPQLAPSLPSTPDPRPARRPPARALALSRNAVSPGHGHPRHTIGRRLRSPRRGHTGGQYACQLARSGGVAFGGRNKHR
jgi:hypothetical protein